MTIQSVLGPINAAELDQTLMYEYITYADWSMRTNFGARFFEFDQVTGTAAGQLGKVRALDVRTMVNGTPVNLGQNIRLIREVACHTGLSFITSTGLYYQEEPWLYFRDEEEICDLLMDDCADGISGTDSKPDILKADVDHGDLTPLLQKMLHATGRVTKETGLPLFYHHGPSMAADGAILDLLVSCDVSASRVILGHSGDTDNLEYLTAVLKRSCWLGMDRFGFCDQDLGLEPRVDTIVVLCRADWGHRLLLNHDLAVYLAFWDSWETTKHSDWLHLEEDYTFVHRRVFPLLEKRGLSRADIDRLPTDSPRAFFEGV